MSNYEIQVMCSPCIMEYAHLDAVESDDDKKTASLIRISDATGNEVSKANVIEIRIVQQIGITGLEESLFENFVNLTCIELRGNNIKELPEKIFHGLNGLRYIDFNDNMITSLHNNTFKGLSQLESIDFGNNQIKELPEYIFQGLLNLKSVSFLFNLINKLREKTFCGLKELESIEFSKNNLSELPKNIFNGLSKVKWINFLFNKIEKLPEKIFAQLKDLRSIDFRNNQIEALKANTFNELTNLMSINFSYNQIKAMSEHIFKGLDSLESINFGYNQIFSLDTELFRGLKSLKEIHFSHNMISELDERIFKNLKKLESISIKANKIKSLKSNLFQGLLNLKQINFSSNHIEQLEVESFQTSSDQNKLTEIKFSNNKITELKPGLFGKLMSLESIDFSQNKIKELNKNMFQGLMNLLSIDFSSNKISTLDPEIFRDLSRLQEIFFQKNAIKKLDSFIFNGLKNLKEINLRMNQLTSLNSNIFTGLGSLEQINLSFNQIGQLDVDLFQIMPTEKSQENRLKTIWLSNNKISKVSSAHFRNLTYLESMDLSSNQIIDLPQDIFQYSGNLKSINFGFNQIARLHENTFQGLIHLKSIQLGSNQINELSATIFRDSVHLKKLDLSNNLIAKLNCEIFRTLNSLEEMNFRKNQIQQLDKDILVHFRDSLIEVDFGENRIVSLDPKIFHDLVKLRKVSFDQNQITHLDPKIFQSQKDQDSIQLNFTCNFGQLDSFIHLNHQIILRKFFEIYSWLQIENKNRKPVLCNNTSYFNNQFFTMLNLSLDEIVIDRNLFKRSQWDLMNYFDSLNAIKDAASDPDCATTKKVGYFSLNNFSSLDFCIRTEIKNNTLINLVDEVEKVFKEKNITESYFSDFKIINPESVTLLIRRNCQNLFERLIPYFDLESYQFSEYFEVALKEEMEGISIAIFKLLWHVLKCELIKNNAEKEVLNSEELKKLYEKSFSEFNLNHFLKEIFNKNWCRFYEEFLDHLEINDIEASKRENNLKKNQTKMFFLMIELTVKSDEKQTTERKASEKNGYQPVSIKSDECSEKNYSWKFIDNASKNHLLYFLTSKGQEKLILHSTTINIFDKKWIGEPRFFYWLHLMLYIVFVIIFTHYLDNMSTFIAPKCQIDFLFIFLCLLLVIFILSEIFQWYCLGFWGYLNSWQNIFEIINFKLCFFLLISIQFDIISDKNKLKLNILKVTTTLLTYLILLLRLEWIEYFGIYITVIKKILKRYLNMFPLFLISLFCFLFAFRFLSSPSVLSDEEKFEENLTVQFNFSNKSQNVMEKAMNCTKDVEYFFNDKSIRIGLVDLLTMTLGDFHNDEMDLHVIVNFILYSLFLFVLSILAINIFVGISVDEISKLIDDSKIQIIMLKVEYLLKIQDTLTRKTLLKDLSKKFLYQTTFQIIMDDQSNCSETNYDPERGLVKDSVSKQTNSKTEKVRNKKREVDSIDDANMSTVSYEQKLGEIGNQVEMLSTQTQKMFSKVENLVLIQSKVVDQLQSMSLKYDRLSAKIDRIRKTTISNIDQ